MALIMKPTNEIIIKLGLQPDGPVQQWFTDTCALHMDKYIPWDEGHLAETVVINGEVNRNNVTADTITYAQPYAVYVYYPTRKGKYITYQTDVHEHAGPYWDSLMWSAEKEQVMEEVENYMRTRGGK